MAERAEKKYFDFQPFECYYLLVQKSAPYFPNGRKFLIDKDQKI